MTKQRHCFVTQVGDAIEKLASALDSERRPPFKGDILDLLEWAERDVLEMRQQLVERDKQVTLLSDFVTKISEQLPEKPDHWSSCSQCEHNASDAQDIIEELVATAAKEN